jgi:DNA/RNA-binding domain of Phe-tRNA-synthetase-like protein
VLKAEAFLTYSPSLMARFADFVAAILFLDDARGVARDATLDGIAPQADPADSVSIKAWRGAYSDLGINPTKTRNAAEALLRRYNKTGGLPRINPVVDACNLVSVKHHLPVAALDVARLPLPLVVKPAAGAEPFVDISGNASSLNADEVSFFDAEGVPHARYWNHKQSGQSAVREGSTRIVITVEAMHPDGEPSVRAALADLLRVLAVELAPGGAGRMAWLYSARTRAFSPLA